MWNPLRRERQKVAAAVSNNYSTGPRRGSEELLRAYREQPWFRAPVKRIAQSVASVEPCVFVPPTGLIGDKRTRAVKRLSRARSPEVRSRAAHEWVTEYDHPVLDLLDAPNPFMPRHALMALSAVHLLIVGEICIAKERDENGQPRELWPFPPHWVKSLPTPSTPYYLVSINGTVIPYPTEDIIFIRDHDPLEPYKRGSGTGYSLGDELDSDEYAAKFTKAFFNNGTHYSELVTIPGASEEFLKKLQAETDARHGGPEKAHRRMYSNTEGKLTANQFDFSKLSMREQRLFWRDLFVQVYGVPPEILGILTNSNRATISAADYIYARHVLVPLLEAIYGGLRLGLADDFQDGAVLGYESPVQADGAFQLDVLKVRPEVASDDEWRQLAGLEPERDDPEPPPGYDDNEDGFIDAADNSADAA